MASMVDRSKGLDAKIASAGGLAPYWIAGQERARLDGEAHYDRLIDPATGRVIAEVSR